MILPHSRNLVNRKTHFLAFSLAPGQKANSSLLPLFLVYNALISRTKNALNCRRNAKLEQLPATSIPELESLALSSV